MVDLESYHFELSTLAAPLSWPEFFGNARPVELEIGSGKGLFLANAATARPEHNFLGIELSRKYARRAAERVAKRALTNVKVIQGDARIFMSRYVPAASVLAVHIYFPDPWWKKRHKKRRVFTAEFVGQVERALVPTGEFSLATDVAEYYAVMMEIMAAFPRFVALPPPESNMPAHDLDYLTNFERKYRIEGREILRARYRLMT